MGKSYINKIKDYYISLQIRKNQDRGRFHGAIKVADDMSRSYLKNIFLNVPDSKSTGCENSDYYVLHKYILTHKPKKVLEFGSGLSSIFIAHALNEIGGHLITFEAVDKYYRDFIEIIPNELRHCITPILANSIEADFCGIRGVRFDCDLPDNVDLVFVDGPTETLADGNKGACLDFLFYLQRYPSDMITSIIDRKFSSLVAYQALLPKGKVYYDPIYDLGFISNIKGEYLSSSPKISSIIPHGSVIESLSLKY